MKTKEITLQQILDIEYYDMDRNTDLITETHIIQRYDDDPDKFDIYTLDQAEDSDPNPLFTGTAQEMFNFIQTL